MGDYASFEAGVLTDVWTFVGYAANGNKRFRRANFDLLNWDAGSGAPSTYVVPLGLERISQAEIILKDTPQVGHEFGYYGGDSAIVDSIPGDGSDTFVGLNCFGYV